ncbi:MAG: endo-1,4-beta-xylanase [Eubacteriales bacterium]|nr:endo-1,4-beta-xylanase [Eubacteriales bacterium]MDD4513407.1 endo-1,4-beta-xylanase [Eubacteriales bacterium]
MKKLLSVFTILTLLIGMTACAKAGDSSDATENYPSLYSLTENYGFKSGAVINYGNLSDNQLLELFKHHFDSLTAANEMKAYSLLDQKASAAATDGMPRMNFTQADAIVSFAAENGIKIRGHVLVWDAYMTDWFFREGYLPSGSYADAETLRARLKSYIEQVITHFEQNFPGVVYCWDVVNEAVADDASERVPNDPRHLRAKRSGSDNIFYKLMGADYVETAFLYARDTVDALGADIKLFYNDYNAFYPEKRAAILKLAESINSFDEGRKLCDGIGMQGYIGGYGTQNGCLDAQLISYIKDAIKQYSGNGYEVQLTEMAVRTYQYDDATAQKHAQYYADLYNVFKTANSGDSKPLTAVCIWGFLDCNSLPSSHYSFKLNSPYCGLFTEDYAVKPSFKAVIKELEAK